SRPSDKIKTQASPHLDPARTFKNDDVMMMRRIITPTAPILFGATRLVSHSAPRCANFLLICL
ncbi:hypothetical protein, partial [Methyloceanibacter sp.]|uniref:hypothetical protein n=1 Tax=Methyloceanibacter sp. TaxID=1965321 RepID=UPI003C706B73